MHLLRLRPLAALLLLCTLVSAQTAPPQGGKTLSGFGPARA